MTVGEIMHRGVASVHKDLSLRELGRFLVGSRISGAPVLDDHGRPIGVVTLADLTAHAAGLDRQTEARYLTDLADPPQASLPEWERLSEAVTAESLMTTFMVRVEEDTPLPELLELVVQTRIHRVFVTHQGKLTGVVSTLDLVRLLGRLLEGAGRDLSPCPQA